MNRQASIQIIQKEGRPEAAFAIAMTSDAV